MTKERHIFRSGRRRLRLLILPAVLLAAAGGGVWFWFEHSPARAVERMLLSIKGLEAEQVEEQSPDRILIRRISYRADDGVAAGCEGLEIGLDANGVPRSVSAAGVEIVHWHKAKIGVFFRDRFRFKHRAFACEQPRPANIREYI